MPSPMSVMITGLLNIRRHFTAVWSLLISIIESSRLSGHLITEHTAATHHLIGDRICLRTVYDDRTAVIFSTGIVIKRRTCLDVQRTAIDIDIAVGIHRISITLTHIDGNITAVDLDCSGIIRYLLTGIDPIIRSCDGDVAAVYLNISSFDTFMGIDADLTVIDLYHSIRVDRSITEPVVEKYSNGVFYVQLPADATYYITADNRLIKG